MAFSGPVEKPSADGARRRAMKPDPVQAIEAKNSFAGIFKKPPACFAEGREKRQFGQPADSRKNGRPGQIQAVSDSLFSWQSMQRGVQGRWRRRFLPISF